MKVKQESLCSAVFRFKQQGDDTSLLLLLFLGVVLLAFGMCGLKAVDHVADCKLWVA